MGTILASLDERFIELHRRSIRVLELTPNESLFVKPRVFERTLTIFSVGEYILRSAGAVEQTFGGISTRLWDDPFEWTLPEHLSTTDAINGYLYEVEQTRRQTFKSFGSDDDLHKLIPAPERLRPIFDLLLETLSRASHYQGRAYAVLQMLSDEKLPGI